MKNIKKDTIATISTGQQLDIFSDVTEAPKESATHPVEMPKIVPTIRTQTSKSKENCGIDATVPSKNILLYQYIYDNLNIIRADKNWTTFHTQQQERYLKNFCEFNGLGLKPITEITTKDISLFLQWCETRGERRYNRGLSPSTVNRYCAAISNIFKFAVENNDLEFAPKVKWRKSGEGRIRRFSSEEIQKLLDFFQNDEYYGEKAPWIRDMMIVGLYTGMRRGELIQIGSKATLEKDDEGYYLHVPTTKNGEPRDIPVDRPELLEAIKRLGNVSSYFSAYLFTSAWKKAKRTIAPNDPSFCSHVLRHTAASHMANVQKLNLLVIADYLGHKALQTTRKYVHVSRKAKREAVKSMDYGVAI